MGTGTGQSSIASGCCLAGPKPDPIFSLCVCEKMGTGTGQSSIASGCRLAGPEPVPIFSQTPCGMNFAMGVCCWFQLTAVELTALGRFGWTILTMIIINRIQMAAMMIVKRVNLSPAREPNALDPPMPPSAPAKPPPLPFWMRTRRMRKMPMRRMNQFNKSRPRSTQQIAKQLAQQRPFFLIRILGPQKMTPDQATTEQVL